MKIIIASRWRGVRINTGSESSTMLLFNYAPVFVFKHVLPKTFQAWRLTKLCIYYYDAHRFIRLDMFTQAAVVAGKHNISGFWNPTRAPVDSQQFQHGFCYGAADARSRSYRWWPVRSLTVRESDILLRASSWLGYATSKTNFLLESIVISCGKI